MYVSWVKEIVMPWIEVSEKAVQQLERISPDHLKGGRKTTTRVHWAIDALVTIYDQQESGRLDGKERISDSPPLCQDSN